MRSTPVWSRGGGAPGTGPIVRLLGLLRRGLPALPTGRLLLRRGAALLRAAPRSRALASAPGGPRRVGDSGGALLRHALVLQGFVLLLVLDARSLVRHRTSFMALVVGSCAIAGDPVNADSTPNALRVAN